MLQFRFGLSDFWSTTVNCRVARNHQGTCEESPCFYDEPAGDDAPAVGMTLLLTVASARPQPELGHPSARGDDKADTELLKPFQGTWASSGEGIDATWTFDGDKIKASVAGMEYTCKAKIDKDAKPHASIDLTVVDGPEEAKGKVSRAFTSSTAKSSLCASRPERGD